MALFLESTISHRFTNINIHTVLAEMVELQMEGTSLSEAIMQADFILHEAEKLDQDQKDIIAANKTEVNKTAKNHFSDLGKVMKGPKVHSGEKDMSFFKKSKEAILAFVRKVWFKIKQVGAWIKDRVKVAIAKLTGSKSGVVKVYKGTFMQAKATFEFVKLSVLLTKRKYESAQDYSDALTELKDKYDDKIKDNGDTDIITVSKGEFKKYFDDSDKVATELEGALAEFSKKLNDPNIAPEEMKLVKQGAGIALEMSSRLVGVTKKLATAAGAEYNNAITNMSKSTVEERQKILKSSTNSTSRSINAISNDALLKQKLDGNK